MQSRTIALGAVGVLMLGMGIGSCHNPVETEYKTTYIKVPTVETKVIEKEKEVVRITPIPTSCLDTFKHLNSLSLTQEEMSSAVGKLHLASQDLMKHSIMAEPGPMNNALQTIRDEKGRLGSLLSHNHTILMTIEKSMDKCNADMEEIRN